MLIAFPRETAPGEKRVAATPDTVRRLRGLGYEIVVERGAGAAAGFDDARYVEAGARVVDAADVFSGAGIVCRVRPPAPAEVERLDPGALLVSLVQPDRHPGLLDALAARRVSVLALEKIPRTTRAQAMDVLSSSAVVAGHRAIIEAAQHFQGFFGPQVTAAGSTPPAKVLIIGAGVAGLAAIGTARALGAQVRAFDTRAAAREQVESLGATFLTIALDESGDGAGGYAKVMSPEYLAAEIELFKQQAAEVDVIVTTALVPGQRAPVLLTREVVEALRPGSVIVDLAAEQGGNCEFCRPGEVVTQGGVTIVGHTDLPSRMAHTASRFFANNVANLLADMAREGTFRIDLENDVVRPALLLHEGEPLPPVAPPAPTPMVARPEPPPPTPAPLPVAAPPPPKSRGLWTGLAAIAAAGGLLGIGPYVPPEFLQHLTVFVLACFVGWQVVWAVTPALHTPLMSVTNAISGIIIVGGILQTGDGLDLATVLGAAAVLFAAINVAGGFLVTQRMLRMFRREGGAA